MTDMPKSYDFKAAEERLYSWWERNGWFKPESRPADAQPFVIMIPPPNVTGKLHQGHVLFAALEDLMIRKARMQGKAALWVPGTDHAGIATQLQVEKHIRSEYGKSRQELGREAFEKEVWAWKDEHGGKIVEQLRRLGASCDWDRERFTLDEGLSKAVREAFVRLYGMGLIYQGEYLVNWSPGLQTAVSDLEVEHSTETGMLYHFRYPLKGGGYLPVATTRPETILADTAVAVHPDDPRYQEFIGRTALVPMLDREIPVIADDYVDIAFGTGALKVTPGHDQNDFEIGLRHGLEIIGVMTLDATMNSNAGPYADMDRSLCRERLWSDMEKADLTIKTEVYEISVPRSQRGGEVIEPMVSKQWFVDAAPMAQMALEAVREGRINIVPERFGKVWENWLTNIRPWCISRQLWWGHRIPVWHCQSCGHPNVLTEAPETCQSCHSGDLVQDPDVLDTWFSSGLWPFSALGWPEQTDDLARFFPTDILETGHDILFFWVARMVMMSLVLTNDIPFHTVYLHGLVRDRNGRKMSKSAGNVVDPLELMDQYGADALRFTLLTTGAPGNDMNLASEKVASNRNFTNKIWNVTRYVLGAIDSLQDEAVSRQKTAELSTADLWISTRLSEVIDSVDRLTDGHNYGEAGRQIQDFFWSDFADWYIEVSKVALRKGGAGAQNAAAMLIHVLDSSLRLLHPYMPFVTEESWQQMRSSRRDLPAIDGLPTAAWPESLMISEWPTAGIRDSSSAAQFEYIRAMVKAIRSARAEHDLPASSKLPAVIAAGRHRELFEAHRGVLQLLARLDADALQIVESAEPDKSSVTVSVGELSCYLLPAVEVSSGEELVRLNSQLAEVEQQIQRLQALLSSAFADRAPGHLVDKERAKLAEYLASKAEITLRLADIEEGAQGSVQGGP